MAKYYKFNAKILGVNFVNTAEKQYITVSFENGDEIMPARGTIFTKNEGIDAKLYAERLTLCIGRFVSFAGHYDEKGRLAISSYIYNKGVKEMTPISYAKENKFSKEEVEGYAKLTSSNNGSNAVGIWKEINRR